MAESSLSVAKSELDIAIAHFLGYSRDSDDWDTPSTDNINQARSEALADFYAAHDWNFLTITTTLTCDADDYEMDLPDDFGSIREEFYFAADEGYAPLVPRSVGFIRHEITRSSTSSVPKFFAIEALSQDGSSGTRYQLLVYPPPDSAYVLTYRYRVLRDALTSTYPYPAGGMLMRSALIAGCRAAADRIVNDSDVEEKRYRDKLGQAIAQDSLTSPRSLGIMGDTSDRHGRSKYENQTWYGTYNGATG